MIFIKHSFWKLNLKYKLKKLTSKYNSFNYVNIKKSIGFTLIELLISISISTLIIWGISYFVVKISSVMNISQNRTQLYSNLTDFIEKIKKDKNTYRNWEILVDNELWFDVILLTNNKWDRWLIIWVVNINSNNVSYMKLDPVSNLSNYWNKVLAIKPLTSYQIQNINSSWSGYVYNNLLFNKDDIYPYLQTKNFSVTWYNSGKILEAKVQFQEIYIDAYKWKNINSIPDTDSPIDITLIL